MQLYHIPNPIESLAGLNKALTSFSETSSKCLCVHFGVSPLSISKHLTPYEKF